MFPEGANMKVFDSFASPRWSEAEPGVGRKKMGVPGGGQQKPLTGNCEPIVSCFARRGDSLRGVVISHEMDQDREWDRNWAWVWDVRPLRDGVFWGACVPRFPCTFGAAVTWGLYIPSGVLVLASEEE
jgi:hypothetical protein